MLPISVLVPTRNSMPLLPGHIQSMRPWLELAEEIVVVDSHSQDGTPELLERELGGPRLRLLSHPPGLYQSWNFGIAQCRAKYIYISTVGDAVTRPGLEELAAAAEMLSADITLSPPRMVTVAGEPKGKTWPIHSLIEQLGLAAPVSLHGAGAQLFAFTNLLRGILGSSASNLYRTETLQRFPFRTDFGTAGDLAWGLEHAAEVRWAIVPRAFSTFVFHPKAYSKRDYAVEGFHEKCLALAKETLGRAAFRGNSGDEAREMTSIVDAWDHYLQARRTFLEARCSPLWWLRPSGWKAYRARARERQRLGESQRQAIERLRNHVIPASIALS
jgi:glycosyltransferase involved in cell wall biosynthesis